MSTTRYSKLLGCVASVVTIAAIVMFAAVTWFSGTAYAASEPSGNHITPKFGFPSAHPSWPNPNQFDTTAFSGYNTTADVSYDCPSVACSYQWLNAFQDSHFFDCPFRQAYPSWPPYQCLAANGTWEWYASGEFGITGQDINITYCEVPEGSPGGYTNEAAGQVGAFGGESDAFAQHSQDGFGPPPQCS